MFKNMKLATKMGVGFGSLIVIVCLLGGLAIYNMTSVTSESEKLANEYVPEVRLANNVERSRCRQPATYGRSASPAKISI